MEAFVTHIGSSLAWDPEDSFCKKCICHMRFSGSLFSASFVDVVIGLLSGLGTLLTAGMASLPREGMGVHLKVGSRSLLTKAYEHILLALQPCSPCGNITTSLMGDRIVKAGREVGACYRNHPSRLKHHVTSRLCYALFLVVVSITRVGELAIGFVAAVFSILSLGHCKPLNTVACRGLYGTLVFYDVFCFMTKIINPWAKIT